MLLQRLGSITSSQSLYPESPSSLEQCLSNAMMGQQLACLVAAEDEI